MKKLFSLTLLLIVFASFTAAAPLQIEIQKLMGAEVSSNTTITVENKSVQPRQSQPFSIFQSYGYDIIQPGNAITGELELTFDCGGADVCRGDFWLKIDGERYFAEGNTYWASTGETVTVTVHANAPTDTGVYIAEWYQGSKYSPEEGFQIDTDSFVVAVDSDEDGVADSEDDCPETDGSELYDGCPPPDSDNDGVPDDEDECKYTGDQGYGLKDNGCPIEDRDGDDIPDPNDDCINEQGSSSTDGCPDADGDGTRDSQDQFPDDPDCVEDSDNDGACDAEDEFPNDPTVTEDSDSDGVGDANDEYPDNPDCTSDSDNDGVCDSNDAFPDDGSVSQDSDGDGVGDSNDEFPNDSSCSKDTDGDQVCNSEDQYPIACCTVSRLARTFQRAVTPRRNSHFH